MKMNFYFIWSCFAMLCLAMLMVSCQKNESAEVITSDFAMESTERNCISNCTQCAQNFCCCRIDLLDPTNQVFIQICGDLPGCISMDTCSISSVGNCPEIRGILVDEVLSSNITFFYCHERDGAIRIRNTSTEDILVRITCMVDDVTSKFTDVFIAGLGVETIYVDMDCEPDECN